MTRKKARILVMLFTVVCLLSVTCLCFAETPSILRYKHTSRITAYLGISGGTADCRGSVAPSEPVDCSLRVVLYKQSGNSWIQVASWIASFWYNSGLYILLVESPYLRKAHKESVWIYSRYERYHPY